VEDKANAYNLYAGTRLVAKFGHARLMPRFGAEHLSLRLGGLA
jgi:hypothetical protein